MHHLYPIGLHDNAEHFTFIHDEQFFAINLDRTSRVLTKKDFVPGFEVYFLNSTVIQFLSRPYCNHLTLGRFLGRRVGDYNTAS